MMNSSVVAPYVKDNRFEDVLDDINTALLPVEREYISQFTAPRYPVIFIAGTQRSGTTLLMQLMISCFKVGYVSNLMARFWRTPYIGALLANELRRKQKPQPPNFESKLGTTYGYDGPHEFGYFWQHWFPYNETHQPNDEELAKKDWNVFRRELAAMESVFNTSLVFKNPIVFSLNIETLAKLLPTAVFVICRRNPQYVAQSTLLARQRFHGNRDTWWSIKPKEYRNLKDCSYAEQIAGQIYYTEQRIRESLISLDSSRYIMIEYETLCANPVNEIERIQDMVTKVGANLLSTDYNPKAFQHTNVQRLNDEEFNQLRRSGERFWGKKALLFCHSERNKESGNKIIAENS